MLTDKTLERFKEYLNTHSKAQIINDMKQKTAIQELIKEMESLLEQPYVNPKNALNDCINLAWAKLKKEQTQIFDAYVEGCEDTYGVDEPNPDYPDFENAKDYYKRNFEQ
jgi:hypothetical protein